MVAPFLPPSVLEGVKQPLAVRTVGLDPKPASQAPVLVVYPYCLDQVGHGNIQRVLSMARHLAASGFTVDLVYQSNPRVAPVTAQYSAFRRVYRVEGGALSSDDEACARRLAAFYCTHEAPAANLRPSAPLTTLVRALVEAEPYQAVVATYAWMAPAFVGLARRVPLVCDVQDILHEHAEACHRTTGHSSSFSLPAATEAFLWRQWDVLVAITPEDVARVRRDLLPQQRLISARHAAPEIAEVASAGDDDVALYAGSDNMSNVQALQWLLEQVWPRVVDARPQARLRIAGLICRALPPAAAHLPGVDVLGFRTDLREDVARAGVIVAPYLYGSGLKIKVVEAACAGKAIVTTPAGVAGTGLECRDAVAVENDAVAFAAVLVQLLGNGDRRREAATATLNQARRLYSPAACYGPVVSALRHLSPASRSAAPAFHPAALGRITTVVDHVRPVRVVLWGNGTHTRVMVVALKDEGISIELIVDGRATTASVSPEGIPVTPGTGFGVVPGDLVILSSETFENDMWHALTDYRAAGGWVLGLWDERRISRAILDRLSPVARAELGAPPLDLRTADAPPAVVLWDSSATPSRWWRTGVLQELARAAHRRGLPVVIAGPSNALDGRAGPGWPENAKFMPVLELDGRAIEAIDDPGGTSDLLTRLASVSARAAARAIDGLGLGRSDLLMLMSPSLTECFGIARALAVSGQPGPSIVVHGLAPLVDGPHWSNLSEPDRQTYWRLAMSELAEAADGRLHLVGFGSTATAALGQFFDRPVSIAGPSLTPERRARDGRPGHTTRVLCLGHVCANVRTLLEALVHDASAARPSLGPVSCAWRSSGHGSGPVPADRWASGLATMLGVELLDDRTPSEMLAEIAAADVVILADSVRDQWATVVASGAAAAGVPVIASAGGPAAQAIAAGAIEGDAFAAGNPTELLAALGRVMTTRRTRTQSAATIQESALGAPGSLFDQLLDASGFERDRSLSKAASPCASTHTLTTEIAHAATY